MFLVLQQPWRLHEHRNISVSLWSSEPTEPADAGQRATERSFWSTLLMSVWNPFTWSRHEGCDHLGLVHVLKWKSFFKFVSLTQFRSFWWRLFLFFRLLPVYIVFAIFGCVCDSDSLPCIPYHLCTRKCVLHRLSCGEELFTALCCNFTFFNTWVNGPNLTSLPSLCLEHFASFSILVKRVFVWTNFFKTQFFWDVILFFITSWLVQLSC